MCGVVRGERGERGLRRVSEGQDGENGVNSGGKIWGVAFAFGWMKTCEFVEHPPPCRTSG